MGEMTAHPTAVIEAGATIGPGVKIGPYCVVGADVTLGEGVELLSHVIVTGRNAPQELMDLADTVTEMTMVKHHFKAGVPAQRGIED